MAQPTASLTVLSGPLAGTRLDIDGSDEEVLVGADPDCRLALDLPGVSPIHARLSLDQGELIVHDTRSPRGVYVNDTRVTGQAPLRDGDVLWLGTPGEDESVMLQCRVTGGVPLPAAVMPDEASAAPVVFAEEEPPPPVVFADAPPADAVDPMADMGDLLAIAPPDPPQEAPVPPAPEAPGDDVFFMDEPAVVVPPPPPEPPPVAQQGPPGGKLWRIVCTESNVVPFTVIIS